MSEYLFDVEVAKVHGVDAAIILRHLKFWLEKNAANGTNIHDGEVWTFNSIKAWHTIFPFWTEKQIENRLNTLAEKGVISKGNYNKSKYDRTCWYTIKSPELRISPNGEMDFSKQGNQIPGNVEPIPYKNTDKRTYKNKQDHDSVMTDPDFTPPEGINLQAWKELDEYRLTHKVRKVRECWTPKAKSAAVNLLLPLSKEAQLHCVQMTVANGWQGIFPDRINSQPQQKPTQSMMI